MKWLTLFLLFAFISCAEKNEKDDSIAEELTGAEWIDLTYDFSDKTLYWPTANGFKLDTAFHGVTAAGFYYEAYNYCAAEHGGTHLDAPVHFAKGKWTADEIPLEKLTGDAVVIDLSEKALKDPDYLIGITDIESWEKTNGKLPDNIILFFRTGYGAFYPDAKKISWY